MARKNDDLTGEWADDRTVGRSEGRATEQEDGQARGQARGQPQLQGENKEREGEGGKVWIRVGRQEVEWRGQETSVHSTALLYALGVREPRPHKPSHTVT